MLDSKEHLFWFRFSTLTSMLKWNGQYEHPEWQYFHQNRSYTLEAMETIIDVGLKNMKINIKIGKTIVVTNTSPALIFEIDTPFWNFPRIASSKLPWPKKSKTFVIDDGMIPLPNLWLLLIWWTLLIGLSWKPIAKLTNDSTRIANINFILTMFLGLRWEAKWNNNGKHFWPKQFWAQRDIKKQRFFVESTLTIEQVHYAYCKKMPLDATLFLFADGYKIY